MNYDLFNQFEAYTNNTLPADQRQTLKQQIASDDSLQAELDAYLEFRYSIEAVALKHQLERLHIRLDREGALVVPPAFNRPRRLRPAWVATAVVILLLSAFGLYWANRPTLAEQTFLAYYEPEPISRGMTVCGPELSPGLQSYRTGNFNSALVKFSQLPVNQPCVRYYRGLTQLALGNATVAIAELEQAINQRPADDDLTIQKTEWYLALAYLKANRTADAHTWLTAITNQSDHPFQSVAQKALDKLGHE